MLSLRLRSYSRGYDACMAWNGAAESYVKLQRRGRRLAVALLVCCAALSGLAAIHIWNVARSRQCMVIGHGLASPPHYRCSGSSTPATTVVFGSFALQTSIPAP